jgi:F-type H+-transporting ATPase subunit gamma
VAQPRVIRKRIISIRNIHKITHTMERVAQSRTARLSARRDRAHAFSSRLANLVLVAFRGEAPGPEGWPELLEHPLCRPRPEPSSALLLVITTNRGLCGGYNARVLETARARAGQLAGQNCSARWAVAGRKGMSALQFAGIQAEAAQADEELRFGSLQPMLDGLLAGYLEGRYQALEVVSMRFRTKAVQEPRAARLLPYIPQPDPRLGAGEAPPYLCEPDRPGFLAQALPLLVKSELYALFMEARLCEQLARTLAMRSATENADDMAKRLARQYNRARQTQITREMIEIIGGSEGRLL